MGSSQGLSGSDTMACSGWIVSGDQASSLRMRGVLPATAQNTFFVAMFQADVCTRLRCSIAYVNPRTSVLVNSNP